MSTYGSWKSMRGDDEPRDWMRRDELMAKLAERGVIVNGEQVLRAIREAGMPDPPRRYRHFHYTDEHLEAVAAWATAKAAKKARRVG